MGIGMNFGVITHGDIATELASRGISVGTPPPPPGEELVAPPGQVMPRPEAPEQPITVMPPGPIVDYYEPYIPIYPPAVVTPEDVTEEIVPYVPRVAETVEEKGLSKGLLILVGITAFALMALAKPKPPQRTRAYTRRRF